MKIQLKLEEKNLKMTKKINYERVVKEIEDYLKLQQYTYSLGGPLYMTHTTLIKSIRDYIDYSKEKPW